MLASHGARELDRGNGGLVAGAIAAIPIAAEGGTDGDRSE
jgi:hypothetical protein